MAEKFGQRIQTTVAQRYLPFVVDTILNSNVHFQRVVRASKKWSGRTLRSPIKVSKNSTGQSFAGFDTFSTAATDNRQFLEFTPKFYQITVALPGDELSVADTDDEILDLMKLTIQSDTEDMADDLGTIFYADGTGNSSKDMLGLAALVDNGDSVANIGGLARSTFTTLKSTITATGGTLTLALIDTHWTNISSGAQNPDIAYVTEAVFNFYGQLLRPQERINKDASFVKGVKAGSGFTGLAYMGRPVLADEKATAQSWTFVNEDFTDFYALKYKMAETIAFKSQIEGNDYGAPVGLGFSWSDWIIPTNAGAVVGHIYFGGEYITNNPKRHGRLTGITAI